MKITLISPFPDVYSYGIRSISAVAKSLGHDTQVLFLTQEFTEPYSQEVIDQTVEMCRGSDLVGVSLMSNFWDNAVAVTDAVRERLGIPVIWGGIHATIRPEECLQHADYAAVGEAEESFGELLQKWGTGEPVHGIYARDQSDFRKASGPAILDSIPFPDYDCSTHHILEGNRLVPMTQDILRERSQGIYLTIPSRGCPFDCTYCCNVFLNQEFPENRKVRRKSMEYLVRELENVTASLPIFDKIKFDDDAFFFLSVEEMKDFSALYKSRVHKPLMVTGVTPSTIKRDKIETLVDAGLVELRMGIESASEQMRKEYKRPQTENKVRNAAALLSEFGDRLTPYYDLIIDNPWEKEESEVETLKFMTRLPQPFELILYSLTFYPGTDVYDQAKAEGLIKDDIEDVYRKYYHSFRPTYLNSLFEILTHYAHWREPVPVGLFDLAAHPTVRNSPLKKVFPSLLFNRLRLKLWWRYQKSRFGGTPPSSLRQELSPQAT
jgi:radical SAM superfamily enzyme YgiQ (UPF0313 family)